MKIRMFMAALVCLYGNTAGAQTISGNSPVCVGATVSLTTTASSGGTWYSANTAAATIDASTGVVSGVAAGTSNVSYVIGGTTVPAIVTVNAAPTAISGGTKICWNNNTNNTITLSASPSGGTWSSSNTGVVSVNSSTGVMAGTLTAGTVTISYSIPGCGASIISVKNFGSAANIPAITGTADLCGGQSCMLSNSESGGIWWSASSSVPVTSGGVATCTTAITTASTWRARYYFGSTLGTCYTQGPQKAINPIPGPIDPPLAICQATTATFSRTTGATWSTGTWTSSNSGITISSSTNATVVVAIASPGTSILKYTYPSGCYTAQEVTINPIVSAISGTKTVCVGNTTTLGNTAPAGSWESNPSTVASISAGGVVTGNSPGTAIITYSLIGSSCSPSVNTCVVTVNATPTIEGSSWICEESTITLSGSPSGGTWSSNNTTAGAIGATSGILTGGYIDGHALPMYDNCAEHVTITYTYTNGCIATKNIDVDDIAAPLSYVNSPLCVGVIGGVTMSDPIGSCGGTGASWTSSNTGVATVNAGLGYVIGVSEGTATISFNRGNHCYRTTTVTIKPTFSAEITGDLHVCDGLTSDLDCTETGGTWTSSLSTVASVDASTGVVTGEAASSVTPAIVYTLSDGSCKGVHVTVSVCGPKAGNNNTATNAESVLISIKPNPSAGDLIISTTGAATSIADLKITDLLGKVVLSKHINFIGGECQLSLDKFVSGTYIAEIRDSAGNTSNHKIAIEK